MQDLRAPEPRPLKELATIREMARLPRYWLGMRVGLQPAPRGSAKVLVVPGFLTSDSSTWALRRTLRRLGHDVHGWGLGTNRGDVEALLPLVTARTRELARSGPVHLVGWSLGGVLAREVARDEPQLVAQVITLASPIVGGPKYTVAARRYRERGVDVDAIAAQVAARDEVPITVPITALYSPHDGIVCPAACIDRVHDHVTHIEVDTNHTGFGFSPRVHAIVADLLADAS